MKEEIPASGAALLRPQREALLRAVWASRLASEEQLNFIGDWKGERNNTEPDFPKMHEIMSALEERGDLESLCWVMGEIQRVFRRHMNSHPHGGLRAIMQVMGGGFDQFLAIDNLKAASAQSFLAAQQVAEILGDNVIRERIQRISVWPNLQEGWEFFGSE